MERVDSKFCEGCAGALTAKNIELDEMRAALASKEAEIVALSERCAGMRDQREKIRDAALYLLRGIGPSAIMNHLVVHNNRVKVLADACKMAIDAAIESERAADDNGVEIGPRVEVGR